MAVERVLETGAHRVLHVSGLASRPIGGRTPAVAQASGRAAALTRTGEADTRASTPLSGCADTSRAHTPPTRRHP
jgi:hypothetical protein